MSDVLLFQTLDDGDISIESGAVELTDGLESAVYLSLFGGNWQDDGSAENPLQWWGNADAVDPTQRQTSRTQYLLQAISATSGNLKRVEDAALADLDWLTADGYDVSVSISVPIVNRVKIEININNETFVVNEEWQA